MAALDLHVRLARPCLLIPPKPPPIGTQSIRLCSDLWIASMSKSFTAFAVLQLVDQGKIDLDAPIETYLPELASNNPYPTKLTTRHLYESNIGIDAAQFIRICSGDTRIECQNTRDSRWNQGYFGINHPNIRKNKSREKHRHQRR